MSSPDNVGKAGERRVARKLDWLPKEYTILNDIMLRTQYGTTQIDHVVVSPYGIFVIETKNYKGWIIMSKKPAAEKKTTAKKPAAKKPAVVKKGVQEYKDVINWKKWEAHNMNWLYIEVNAGDLMTELEAGVNNIKTVTEAMLDSMLEGDTFIVESEKASTKLTVRYYCDNLSEERRKYSEVNG